MKEDDYVFVSISREKYQNMFYTVLAKRMYVSREFVDAAIHALSLNLPIDPWLQHIMLVEAFNITAEQAALIVPLFDPTLTPKSIH